MDDESPETPQKSDSLWTAIAVWVGIFAVIWFVGVIRGDKPKTDPHTPKANVNAGPSTQLPAATQPRTPPLTTTGPQYPAVGRPTEAPARVPASDAALRQLGALPPLPPSDRPLPQPSYQLPPSTYRRPTSLPPVNEQGSVYVRPHMRDGKYVRGHYRRKPSK